MWYKVAKIISKVAQRWAIQELEKFSWQEFKYQVLFISRTVKLYITLAMKLITHE